MSARRLIVALVLSALLGACAQTSTPRDPYDKSPERQAAEVNTALGSGYMERGEYEVAKEKLERALEYDRSYAPAHTLMAVLYERIGQPDKAGPHYRRAVELDPDDGAVNNNYGQFLCRNANFEAAEPYFLAATADPFYRTPALAWANAGTCALRAGNLDKAESYLRQSLEYDAEFPDALLPMAGLSFRRGSYLQARAFLQRYEATGNRSADSLLLGYRIENELGDRRAAERYREQLEEAFPDSEQARRAQTTR